MQKLLNQRERNIFYLTVAVVIFALIFNFILAPVFSKIDNLNKEIRITRAKLGKYLWLIRQKEAIRSSYQNLSNIPIQEDASPNILGELEKAASECQIKIIDLRPQAQQGAMDLKTEGTMEGYIKFIYRLENSLSFLKIKKFQLSSKSDSSALEGKFSLVQLPAVE